MGKPPTYIAFLLRLWQVETQFKCVWRASLEDPHTGERRGFPDLESLCAFLETQTLGRTRSANDDDTKLDI
jgi:hypothetical protein